MPRLSPADVVTVTPALGSRSGLAQALVKAWDAVAGPVIEYPGRPPAPTSRES